MLYSISNTYKDGYIEDFISTNPNSNQDLIVGSIVRNFKYRITSLMKPGLVTFSNQKYILPGWVPCHPQTQLTDIIHTNLIFKKIVVKEIEKHEFEFMSSNGKDKYFVRVVGGNIKCTCPGFFIVKDKNKGCKHIQEIKTRLLDN